MEPEALTAHGRSEGATDVNQLNDRQTTKEVAEPWEIEGLSESVELAANPMGVCALGADGHVACWGDSGVADGISSWTGEPALISGVEGASRLYSTDIAAFCVERAGEPRLCWGEPSPWEEWGCWVDLAGDVWCHGSSHRGHRGCESHLVVRGAQRVCGLSETAVVDCLFFSYHGD